MGDFTPHREAAARQRKPRFWNQYLRSQNVQAPALHTTDKRGQYDASQKRGRNDPCWCNSGIKSKKCQHTALREASEKHRLEQMAKNRAGECPACKAKAGEDSAFVEVPNGANLRPDCPACGRVLYARFPEEPAVPPQEGQTASVAPQVPEMAPTQPGGI